MKKLSRIQKEKFPKKEGYSVSNRGNYIPTVYQKFKPKMDREERKQMKLYRTKAGYSTS